MQVSIETTSGLERRLRVGVPAARVDQAVDVRLRETARKARINGFRPGKVPMKVIRQRFGAGVRQEVLGEIMSQSLNEAVVQEKLRLASQPSIEPQSVDEGKDLEYVATFEVYPEVELTDLSGVKIVRPQAQVTDADIDEMIDLFRTQQGGWETVERAAATGDQVDIDYRGTRDGDAFEGGSAEGVRLVLGSGQMIPGFEDGIVGMVAGDEKTLDLTFPDDYHGEALRGAAVQMAITLNSVGERVQAPLDESLFEKYGVTEGGEERFRSDIRENMERELGGAVKARVKRQVMEALVDAHPALEVPRALVQREIDAMRAEMMPQLREAPPDLDLESLLPAEQLREPAERRARLGLLFGEIIAGRALKADPHKVREAVEEIASTYEESEEVARWYHASPERLRGVESAVLEDQVVELLLESAKVRDEACSYQDAIVQARENGESRQA